MNFNTIPKKYIGLIFFLTLGYSTLIAQAAPRGITEKIKGMSFLGPESPSLNIGMFKSLQTTRATWVALIPEVTLNRETLQLESDTQNERWGETVEAQIEGIHLAKKAGLKIMLKPHVVLSEKKSTSLYRLLFPPNSDKTSGASWRGTFIAKNASDWAIWEKSYAEYILQLTRIADSLQVELFCIGTELRGSAVNRPQYWKQLIQQVRSIYGGAITYSANWDEFEAISFWNELDFIGIDSYFPINTDKTPSVRKTLKNWKPIKKKLAALSQKENRKILMTEFGYRNVSFAGATPWIHDAGNNTPNDQAQVNLYQAFFQTFWEEPWIAGGFSWNWLHDPQAENNTDFSVQNKPAFKVVQQWYARFFY